MARSRVGLIRVRREKLLEALGLPPENRLVAIIDDPLRNEGELLLKVIGLDMPLARDGEHIVAFDLATWKEQAHG